MTRKERRKAKKHSRKLLRRKARSDGKNKHHIFCRSRGGTDSDKNIVHIDVEKHRRYHMLFENRNPDEIIHYLVDYFWNGQEEWLLTAIKQREVYYE